MTSKAPFAEFVSRFDSPSARTTAHPKILDALPSGFPRPVQELWRLHGFGAYANGLIWTHPPEDFEAVIEGWTGLGSEEAALIARFSFGDFAVWARGRAFFLNVHRGYVDELPGVDFLFEEMLCDDAFLDDFLRRPLHTECTRRLGSLSVDQCFGFVPALALGGTESADSVHKAPLREHLALLAQVNGPVSLR